MKPLAEMSEADLQAASDVELNLLLAERVFGWTREIYRHKSGKPVMWRVQDKNQPCPNDYDPLDWDDWIDDEDFKEKVDWSSTGKGMLEVLEAMKKEWEFSIEYPRKGKYRCWMDNNNTIAAVVVDNASLPRAVAVAALLAVKEKGKT